MVLAAVLFFTAFIGHRLLYQQAYIAHGTLEEYYIYPNDSNKPAYCLEFDYAGEAAPWTSIVRYD